MCLPVKPYKIEREWTHQSLSCAVVQGREASNRCGYVRVPPGHPAFGKPYDDVEVSVHGGLTMAELEPCTYHEDGQGYWFGFDCGHFMDALYDPAVELESIVDPEARQAVEIHRRLYHSFFGKKGEHFWTEEEVVEETNRLAEQLAGMTTP